MPTTADDFLNDSLEVSDYDRNSTISGINQAQETTKKDYRAAYIYANVTSYSQRSVLHECPRKFEILKQPGTGSLIGVANLDFIFGHSVGAGIQTYLITRNKQASMFACLLAWTTDLDSEIPKKGKSSWAASLAVEKFIIWWESEMASSWELASFNGRPATELTFFLDTENGYYHAGHIDAVLRHKFSGRYMVLEIKTTSIKNVDEAQYGNSEQPLGYSLVLDKIVMDLNATNTFEVLYLVYSSTQRALVPLPFTKNRSERMEWLQDLLLDHTTIGTYIKLGYFPKRGDSCWSFGGRCSYYGLCDLKPYKRTDTLKNFDRATMPLPEKVDFEFTLREITAAIIGGSAVMTVVEGVADASR